jgi:hypothetical protein
MMHSLFSLEDRCTDPTPRRAIANDVPGIMSNADPLWLGCSLATERMLSEKRQHSPRHIAARPMPVDEDFLTNRPGIPKAFGHPSTARVELHAGTLRLLNEALKSTLGKKHAQFCAIQFVSTACTYTGLPR